MKLLTSAALCLVAVSCNSTREVEWVDYGDDPMQNPQYMADVTAAGTPGPQHAALAGRAGSWTVEGVVWMEPGAEPMPMSATAEVAVLLDGRTVVEDFRSDFMGMPFEGRLLQGYDNMTGRYWCLWTDNMSTGYWLSHGDEVAPGTLELAGDAADVLTPGGRPFRMTTTTHGDGSYTMKMFDTRPGSGEFQSMELRYTRG